MACSNPNVQPCQKIFIIEDDQVIRESFQHFLALEGYKVEGFAHGRDGLERLHHSPEPCLILLDLMMPIMDGAEFMEEFNKFPATIVPIPVYLCSATASSIDSKKMGCFGFIKKPVDLNILLLIIQKHCEKRREIA